MEGTTVSAVKTKISQAHEEPQKPLDPEVEHARPLAPACSTVHTRISHPKSETRHPKSSFRYARFRSGGCTARGLTGSGIVATLFLCIVPAKYSATGYKP